MTVVVKQAVVITHAVILQPASSKAEPYVTTRTKSAATTASLLLQIQYAEPAQANAILKNDAMVLLLLAQQIKRLRMVQDAVVVCNVLVANARAEISSARHLWDRTRRTTIRDRAILSAARCRARVQNLAVVCAMVCNRTSWMVRLAVVVVVARM